MWWRLEIQAESYYLLVVDAEAIRVKVAIYIPY